MERRKKKQREKVHARMKADRERRSHARAERSWSGRAGGFEQSGQQKKGLPPLHGSRKQKQLSASAPHIGQHDDTLSRSDSGADMGNAGVNASTMPTDMAATSPAQTLTEAILQPQPEEKQRKTIKKKSPSRGSWKIACFSPRDPRTQQSHQMIH